MNVRPILATSHKAAVASVRNRRAAKAEGAAIRAAGGIKARRAELSAKQRGDRMGWALIAACLAALSLMAWGAYLADKANGVSVSQSLAAWGL